MDSDKSWSNKEPEVLECGPDDSVGDSSASNQRDASAASSNAGGIIGLPSLHGLGLGVGIGANNRIGGGGIGGGIGGGVGYSLLSRPDPTEYDDSPLDPAKAFERFAGKIYDLSRVDFSDSIIARPPPSSTPTDSNRNPIPSSTRESVGDRIARLVRETAELGAILDGQFNHQNSNSSSSSSSSSGDKNERILITTSSTTASSSPSFVELDISSARSQVRDLETQLKNFTVACTDTNNNNKESTSNSSSSILKSAPSVIQVLESFSKWKSSSPSSSSSSNSSVPISEDTEMTSTDDDTNIHEPSSSAHISDTSNIISVSDSSSIRRLLEAERRVARLEKYLGPLSELTGTEQSLAVQLESLRQNISILNDVQTSDNLLHKIRALNSELEQALKKRKKLDPYSATSTQSSGSSNDSGVVLSPMDHKLLKLYESAQKFEPIAKTVPSLVAHLVTLKDLHQHAMEVVHRLQSTESTQQELHQTLADQSTILQQLESQIKQNASQFETNFSVLVQRIDDLSGKLNRLESL